MKCSFRSGPRRPPGGTLKHIAYALYVFFSHLGGFGLLALGILDTSFLFMPLGNDLLIVAMTASHRHRMLYYAVMATVGSVLGCVIVDVLLRKGGEEGLEKHVPAKRLAYVKKKVSKNAGWALALACVMPPPFPFTPFLMAASALQYPRKKLFTIIGVFRFVRFTAEGLLALAFGRHILRLADSVPVQAAIIGLIVLCIGGSILSVLHWIRRSRSVAGPGAPKGRARFQES